MSDPLAIYLNDHLAGAKFAIELLEGLRDKHHESSLGKFAAKILDEETADRTLLQKLRDDLDGGRNVLKEAGAWLTERTAQLKLRLGGEPGLGDFETLELLS